MRWFTVIHDLSDIDTVDPGLTPPEISRFQGLSRAFKVIDRHRNNVPFTGAYFGNEFCERLLPRPDELEAVLEKMEKKGLSVVFMTPYLTDTGIDRLAALLELLERSDGAEVVLNDWGVTRFVRKNFPGITPVTGRLVSRMLKEVRISSYLKPGKAPPGALDALKDCGYSNSDYDEVLTDHGIGRVEFDIPPQGLAVQLGEGIRKSVHVPFAYIATGRNCMPGSLNAQPVHKFTPATPCTKECTRWLLQMKQKNKTPDPSGDEALLFQRGNTVFFLEEPALIEEVLSGADGNGLDRVVVDAGLFSQREL